MDLGRVLSLYLRLDLGPCFLDHTALEVTGAIETTGSIPSSDEAQKPDEEERGRGEDTSRPGGRALFSEVPSMMEIQDYSPQRAAWGTGDTVPFLTARFLWAKRREAVGLRPQNTDMGLRSTPSMSSPWETLLKAQAGGVRQGVGGRAEDTGQQC